jgi:hypothetical protein
MLFFGPNVKKMSAAHDIPGLIKILELPNNGKKNIQLRIEAINALSEFRHIRVLEALIRIIGNDSEESEVRSRANTVFNNLVVTIGTITYIDTVKWWNNHKGDPNLIESNRSLERHQAQTRIVNETHRIFKPPKDIEAKIYQQTHESITEYSEVTEWKNRTQPFIDARIQAERSRLEAIWHEEDVIWERDEEFLNQQ